MRRKPSSQGNGGFNNNNGQQRKQNYRQSGGGHGGHSGGGQNRPRKNYAAAREKYLQQARDALAQGDRVLAENYFQHADHCYRMLVEEGYNFRNNNNNQGQQNAQNGGTDGVESPVEELPANVSQLPAFLHAPATDDTRKDEQPPAAVGWEE
jgi:hypothetical protein